MCASECVGMDVYLWRRLATAPSSQGWRARERVVPRPSAKKTDGRPTLYGGLPIRPAARAATLERNLYIQACYVQLAQHREGVSSISFFSRSRVARHDWTKNMAA